MAFNYNKLLIIIKQKKQVIDVKIYLTNNCVLTFKLRIYGSKSPSFEDSIITPPASFFLRCCTLK